MFIQYDWCWNQACQNRGCCDQLLFIGFFLSYSFECSYSLIIWNNWLALWKLFLGGQLQRVNVSVYIICSNSGQLPQWNNILAVTVYFQILVSKKVYGIYCFPESRLIRIIHCAFSVQNTVQIAIAENSKMCHWEMKQMTVWGKLLRNSVSWSCSTKGHVLS